MLFSRKRFALAASVATAALLALPALAGANPGSGPELVQRSGRLVVLHADRLDGTSTRQWELVSGTDALRVRAPDDVWIDPGTPVRLEGTMRNGELVVADSESAVKRTGPSPLAADTPPGAALAAAPDMHDTAVILFGFTDGPTHDDLPSATSNAAALMFGDPVSTPGSVNSYYRQQTYDQIGFSGTIYGPYDIPGPVGTCSLADDTVWNWADQAIAHIPSGLYYRHYVMVFPDLPECGWAGLATVGGSYVWINGAFQTPVIAHELGHNLGLAHAAGLLCTNAGAAVPVGGTCTTNGLEYSDPFDAMGNAPVLRQMSMEHKLELNLVPPAGVQVVSASGTYHLAPMELTPSTPEVLRIPKPDGGNYFVEYRQPIGSFDAQSPPLSGVYVRTESPAVMQNQSFPNADTALIDMHPGSVASPNWTDAKMGSLQIFNDALGGILIQDLSEDVNGATLSITMPVAPPVSPPGPTGGGGAPATPPLSVPTPAPTPPTPPTDVTAKLTKAGEVLLAWRGSAATLGISGYRVLRDGQVIATTSSTAYVDRAPRPGPEPQVTYAVVALDVAGATSLPGRAPPLRAALLRALGASHLKAVRARSGKRKLVRVKGIVSDAQAVCRVRVAGGPWRPCKAAPSGAFAVSLRARGTKPVKLSLRDELGRVKLQTLRVR